ncbi:conjugal transfer protein [Buttiauxella sp. B2]|uniref:conjugal transfer protein n=1 Tax=Buttiauxella sp. B2 TaxID=2587812 RepID=UPI00111EC1D7|nr:conjugal transfer protein [Buttiauxella sp. B2]TNV16109.1 conjugal transfer protein [Buttiauxella sp. B2]
MNTRSGFLNAFCFSLLLLSMGALAGGLDAGTSALTDLKTWIFIILGLAALVYLAYVIIWAFMEKKSWNDVGVALLQVICAGGALAAGNWGLSLMK